MKISLTDLVDHANVLADFAKDMESVGFRFEDGAPVKKAIDALACLAVSDVDAEASHIASDLQTERDIVHALYDQLAQNHAWTAGVLADADAKFKSRRVPGEKPHSKDPTEGLGTCRDL